MKQRVFYYDALKAVSIIVVIIGHVFFYTFHESDNIIWRFIDVVNMAMFMFVSGLLTGRPSIASCTKKIRTLLLPTISVGILYTAYKGLPVPAFFTNCMHYGYWFCLTLFMYNILYLGIDKLCDVLKLSNHITRVYVLWGGVVMLLIVSRITSFNDTVRDIFSLQPFFKFLPYFFYGVTTGKFQNLRATLETSNFLFTLSLVLLIVATCYGIGFTIINIIISITYINVMVYFFHKICENKDSRIIKYIGKRTIDIYLFHYFLLPTYVFAIPEEFNVNSNILISLIVVFVLSLLVLCGTLIFTKFIEFSDILSYILLGKKYSNRNILP